MRVQKTNKMNVDQCDNFILTNEVNLSNLRFFVDKLGEDDCYLRESFFLQIPALTKVESSQHDKPSVNAMLQANITMEMMLAAKRSIGCRNKIDTVTTIPVLMTMNQMNLAQVEFRGGMDSSYHMATCPVDLKNQGFCETYDEMKAEDDKFEAEVLPIPEYITCQEGEVKVVVVAGLPVIRDQDVIVLKDSHGLPDIVTVTMDTANLANICAGALDLKTQKVGDSTVKELVYHRFGEYKQLPLPPPYENNFLANDTVTKCRQTFRLPGLSKEGMIHEIATYLTAHPSELIDIPRSKIQEINYKASFKGNDFRKMSVQGLQDMWTTLKFTASKYFNVMKNFDTGFDALNAPLKWAPVLGFIEGRTPYVKNEYKIMSNPKYGRVHNVVYYGAAGGRLDALMRTYFKRIRARDIREFNPASKKITEEDLKRLKVPKWDYGDITAYTVKDEDVMISDVFMKAWAGTNGNALMSKFVAGLLKGSIVSGNDIRKLEGTKKLTVAAKVHMPLKANLVEYDESYPFIWANTCRPLSTEVILIKRFWMSEDKMEEDVKSIASDLAEAYKDKSMTSRFILIRTRADFEFVIRQKYAAQISEMFYQLDRLTTDWTRPLGSARNRKWFLAAPQMPNMFRSLKVTLATGANAWTHDTEVCEILKMNLEGYRLSHLEGGVQEHDEDDTPLDKRDGPKKKVKKKEKEEPQEVTPLENILEIDLFNPDV